jgi:hypothetical protein
MAVVREQLACFMAGADHVLPLTALVVIPIEEIESRGLESGG